VPGADAGTTGFAAVQWQSNLQPMAMGAYYNNFGVAPGKIPPAGATEASFWAKGAVGGENVTFSVGSAGTAPCLDSEVTAPDAAVLTTTWTKYTIPLPNASYAAGQVNGFTWNVAAAGGSVTFYIDNIVWDVASPGDAGGGG
jgi:hypothetical protein